MSGGNKAMELQMQIRQNAEDLHNFMKELDSWEEDIKKKDKQLRAGNLADLQVCNFNFTSLTFNVHLVHKRKFKLRNKHLFSSLLLFKSLVVI